jgi:3-phytase
VVDSVTYGFIGLERAGGGIMVSDMSDPADPGLVEYVRSDLDISTEGLLFIRSEISPDPELIPLLVVTNEVSGTVTVYQNESLN